MEKIKIAYADQSKRDVDKTELVGLSWKSIVKSYKYKNWTNVVPAQSPEKGRLLSDHLLNVTRESFNSVQPTDGGGLHENDEQNRHSWSIDVQQSHQVHPPLFTVNTNRV
jgi:hypothetical protein